MITTNHFAINCTTEGTIILRWLASLQTAIPANDERLSRVSTSVANIYLIIVNLIIINCLQAIITLIVIFCTPPPFFAFLYHYTPPYRGDTAIPYRCRHWRFIPPPAQRAHTATGTEGFYRHRHRGLVPPPALRVSTGTGTEGSYRHRHWGFLPAPALRARTTTGTEGFYRHRHWGLVPAPAFEGIQAAYPNFYRRTYRQIPPHRHIPVPAYYYRFDVILWLVAY